MITAEVLTLLTDEAVSDWLKKALASALCRDVVDAAHDAQILAKALSNCLNSAKHNEMD